MPNVCNVYSREYLDKHEVYEDQFKDRLEAIRMAKELRAKGFTIKVEKLNICGDYTWVVEGRKLK